MIDTLTVLPGPVGEFCNLPGAKYLPACIAGNAAGTVAGAAAKAIEFGTDPLGYIAQQLQFAAAGLAQAVLGGLQDITHPDLSQAWFSSSYSVSFGMAIFVMVILLGIQLVQLARRQVSGEEVTSTLSFYVPAFFFGSLLGPLLGSLLVALSGSLSVSLVEWGITSNAEMTTRNLIQVIATGDEVVTAFGAVTAIVLYLCMIVALLLTFLVLLVIVITLYLTGVLVPLSLVWLTSPTQRRRGMRLVSVWLGLNFSHVLIFFLLAVTFQMVNGLTISARGAGLQGLANLALAAIALFMATLSPFALMKFGNAVLPSNGPDSPGRPSLPSLPAGTGPFIQGIARDSASAQTARSSPSAPEGEPSTGAGGSSAGGSAGDPGAGPSLVERVKSRPSGSSVSGIEASGSGEGGAPSGASSAGGVRGGTGTATAPPKAAPSSLGAGEGEGVSIGAGSAGSTAGVTAGAVEGGAALSSTGAGAAVGVPLMIAGFALGAAGHVAHEAGAAADAVAGIAGQQMQHAEDDGQGEPRPRRKD